MAIIEVKNVRKHFGKTKAVNDVSFEVNKGRIFGLLGPNGAGKTTTIRMINYILSPDNGEITINGIVASPETQKAIGYMPEERGLYKKMKVFDQLMYLTQLKGMDSKKAKEAINYWLERFDASDWKDKEIS
ncbi:MAG TPA: ABC transporter, partial [Balneolaceae bacterium]|nr:ABC transporter [Balneolaceae bacterium]